MVLTATLLYTRLPILSTQLADSPVPKLSHQAYRNSYWYSKIASIFLDSPIALDDLGLIEKKAVQ